MITTYPLESSKNENEQRAGRRELMNVSILTSHSAINASRGRYESASILLDALVIPEGEPRMHHFNGMKPSGGLRGQHTITYGDLRYGHIVGDPSRCKRAAIMAVSGFSKYVNLKYHLKGATRSDGVVTLGGCGDEEVISPSLVFTSA